MKKWKILVPILVIVLLAGAFWYGGDAPGMQGWTVEAGAQTPAPIPAPTSKPTPESASTPEVAPAPEPETMPESEKSTAPESAPEPEQSPESESPHEAEPVPSSPSDPSPAPEVTPEPETEPEKEENLMPPAPEENPLPIEPEDATISDTLLTCTISVRCDTVLNHMDWLVEGKEGLVPEDGVIFPETEVSFYEGESVFNVLLREMKRNKIHMEYANTPVYNSAYIEGIHNIYEFDVGELSGWMYKVNDWFPNYGCSRYALQDGDVVEWIYSCDLGEDIGGRNVMEE